MQQSCFKHYAFWVESVVSIFLCALTNVLLPLATSWHMNYYCIVWYMFDRAFREHPIDWRMDIPWLGPLVGNGSREYRIRLFYSCLDGSLYTLNGMEAKDPPKPPQPSSQHGVFSSLLWQLQVQRFRRYTFCKIQFEPNWYKIFHVLGPSKPM